MNKQEIQVLEAAYLLKEWCGEIDEGACESCILHGQYDAWEGDHICGIGKPFDWDVPDLPTDMSDPVNHPEHYTAGGIETIDYMRAKLSAEEFAGYLRGNALKYLSRAGKKDNTVEDLKKGQWYLNQLIKELEVVK